MPTRSLARRAAFPLFAWGLVLHSLAIALLFGAFGLSAEAARAIAAWKEIALVILLGAVIAHSAARGSSDKLLAGPDLLIAALIATAFGYLVASEPVFRAGLNPQTHLLGFRDAAFFLLMYFVGRGMPGVVGDSVARGHLFWIAFITSVIAVVEWLVVTPEILVGLGVAAYFQDFLGVAEFTAGNEYGLPMNYWVGVGGVDVQRAGSVFLSGQGFAIPFLLLFPATLVWAFERGRRTGWHLTAFLVVCIGLVLTITRATVAVAIVQTVLYVTLRRRPEWAVLGLVLIGTATFLLLVIAAPFREFVWYTITWQEQSAAGHAVAWSAGLDAFFQKPWGWGLGTADQTAVRAGLTPITGDNLYLKYAVEMGILGVTLLIAVLFAIGARAYRLAKQTNPLQRKVGTIVFLATAGIALNSITASVFNSVPLAWLYFLAAGATVGISQRSATTIPLSIYARGETRASAASTA